jgi:hypothetical protein
MPDRHRDTTLQSALRFLSGWVLPGSVLMFCLASCALLIAQQARDLFWPGEVGYGDFYIFHTVRQFQQTGVIYQDLARELPSVYGPMLYWVLAIPGRFFTGENPLIGPRLIVLAAFLLSVLVAVSITRRLTDPGRFYGNPFQPHRPSSSSSQKNFERGSISWGVRRFRDPV